MKQGTFLSDKAIEILLKDFEFTNLLDIGMGEGLHARAFLDAGKQVTSIDFCTSLHYRNSLGPWQNHPNFKIIQGDFNTVPIEPESIECLWASHILEHQRNPGEFLDKCFRILKPNGIMAVTVPPLKHQIVGGHLTLWNPGLLLYNLILARFDCSKARILQYGYNISVIVRKSSVNESDLKELVYDWLDITRLSKYFPFEAKDAFDGQNFKGLEKY